MIINKSVPLALFCVLLLFQASTSTTSEDELVSKACITSERDALLAFRAGLMDPKNRLASWKVQHCCQWRGVTCSNTTTHVVRLDLRNTYIQYDIESDWFIDKSYALSGEIHSNILSLQHLNYLDLSYNNFNGAKIPDFIGSLEELAYLNLTNAEFGGRIPPQIGNLSNLQYLDLSKMSYLYYDDVTWLMHSSSLKYLHLSSVDLSSVINWNILCALRRLKTLHLSGCGLDDTNFILSNVNFTELVTLNLRGNRFSNPLSLSWTRNLTNLKYVDVSMNEFDGRLINVLGSKNTIEILHLGWNNLTNMNASDLKNLTNLKVLDLKSTYITRNIAEFIIKSLSPHGLQSLDLSWNNLNGNLSSLIRDMTSLSSLYLSNSNLTGMLPLSMTRLTWLVDLDLSNNNFHGSITEQHLSNFDDLKFLWLSGNPLNIIIDTNWMPPFRLRVAGLSSCNLGPTFPQWLNSGTQISYLDISNTSIADEVPVWFWHAFSNASYLDLSQNNLTGRMPKDLEFMSVTSLFLHDNKFHGSIPKLPQNLYWLDLSRNNLSGSLPKMLPKRLISLDISTNAISGSLPLDMKDVSLKILTLKENLLNGSIPKSLCQLQQLQFLDLSRNFFVENIPNCWENKLDAINFSYPKWGSRNQRFEKHIDLKSLILSYNNFSSEFPEYVKYCSNLVLLNLENNNFFGSIPPWIGEKLLSLGFLLLGSNKFSGTIPNQLFELKQLQVLDLSHNHLNGTIPRSLKTLKEMTITNDSDSSVDPFWIDISTQSGDIVLSITEVDTKGQLLDFEGNIGTFKSLDLSCNNLVGYIPKDIGAHVGLRNLNLSRNKIIGSIPTSIGSLQLLESLDLYTNKLSGSIPSSFSNLTFLSHLNLSYNNLSGRIPSGHQLQTLDDPSIYEGNIYLCGFPLPIECSEKRRTPQPLVSEKEDDYEIYMGVIVGFAIGVWIVNGALILCKSWRVVYFKFVDNMYSKLYVFLILNWSRITLNRITIARSTEV